MRTAIIQMLFIAFISAAPLPDRAASAEPMPAGLKGDGTLTLYRPVKDDRKTFNYRSKGGKYDEAMLRKIAHFFRCRLTDQVQSIDPNLVEILDAIEDHFGWREIRLISAYRSPRRNNLMRRQGRAVAKGSLHMRGMAADIEVAGVSPRIVRNFAYSLQQGGVGYYGSRTFIHVDTGRVRTWGWYPSSRIHASK